MTAADESRVVWRHEAERLNAWAGSVRRLVMAAPIRAVVEEVGLPESGHSTAPERAAIREAAIAVVDGWLERDLVALAARSEPPAEGLDVERLREAYDQCGFTPQLALEEWEALAREYAALAPDQPE